MEAQGLVGAAALALVHVLAGRIPLFDTGRPRWLSGAAGISIAYVFVHLLPELAEGQARWLEARPEGPFPWLEEQIYLAALLGLLAAYTIHHVAADDERGWFVSRTGGIAVYNVLIGDRLARLGGVTLGLAVAALGAHVLVNDVALRREHGARYEVAGRFVLAAAILLGALWGARRPPAGLGSFLLTAVLSGGILLNTLQEELPSARRGRLGVFVAGAVGYAALWLLLLRAIRGGG
jgi:hypothetical protein